MLQKIKKWLQNRQEQPPVPTAPPKPRVIPREKHSISRKNISTNALKVMYRLKEHGFQAYLVGGGVRDLLLNCPPKDFDVVTNAHPEQVVALFRNGRIIGRRFLLVHIRFGPEIIEVATFRADNPETAKISQDGMVLRDNSYGTIEDDVCRRDFTINAIYYSISGFKLIDYFNGYQDIQDKHIKLIGDPFTRYREDPVRMLRAIRFAAKLGFTLEKHTGEQIYAHVDLLNNIPPSRLFDEYIKLFLSGASLSTFNLLRQYALFGKLFAQTEEVLSSNLEQKVIKFIQAALISTDTRILEAKTVNPGFLIAVFLWDVFRTEYKRLNKSEDFKIVLYIEAMDIVLAIQQTSLVIPKTASFITKEIWMLQARLENRGGTRASRVFFSPKFRAGLDFLMLRAESGDVAAVELAEWWKQYIHADEPTRFSMSQAIQKRRRKPKHKKPPLAV